MPPFAPSFIVPVIVSERASLIVVPSAAVRFADSAECL